MSALEALIQLVEDGKLEGVRAITSENMDQDYLLMVFPGGAKLEIRATYEYDEGGRAMLVINGGTLPDDLNVGVGKGV